jgi:hypothetical protein
MSHGWRCVVVVLLLLTPGLASGQMLGGTITGEVTDNSGAVMPGVSVSVSGERLIGGARSEVTDARGIYHFENLPPGSYDVKFELQGFKTFEHKQISLSAGFVATVNVRLEVGTLQETVVVTGDAPTVDTKSNVQQTVMGQDVMENIPTGRDLWSLSKIIPGVTVSTYDVGGTQGMQQSGISAHGSRDADKTFAIDGMAVNWGGGAGGSTMVYYDQGMFEEVDFKTSAIPAEVSIGGVFMNMVTKAGGNNWRGDIRYYFANDAMQNENFAEVTKTYNFAGGNPVVTQYDFNATAAGPVKKDTIWFFGSYRRWRVDKYVLAVLNADGSHPVDDNFIWNASGKMTAQVTQNHRFAAVYNYNQKNRLHRQDQGPAFIETKATTVQVQPGFTTQLKYTGILKGNSVFESTLGGSGGTYPERYQKDVLITDLRREDTVLSKAWSAGPSSYENPNYRLQFDNVFSHTRTALGGTHNFKAGVQYTKLFYQEKVRINGDIRLFYANTVPYQVRVYNTPVISTSYIQSTGFFAQDSWSVHNLTLNVGFRYDRANGWIPAQSTPAGTYMGARSIDQRRDVYKQGIPVWRAGAVYDVFGNGNTAIKGNFSRYATQVGIGVVTNVHPFIQDSAVLAWTDRNGNDYPDPNELGTFEGFTGSVTTRYENANGPDWAYSDELTTGIEHQLMKDVRVGVMYYHRTNRKNTGRFNTAVPSSAYTPLTVTNPTDGKSVTIYNLDSAYVGKQATLRVATPLLDTDFNGIETTINKRFTGRWQMMIGFTAGKNKGGIDLGEFNDPNNLVNQQGAVGTDSSYQFRLSGSYLVPRAEVLVSGSFLRNTGYPRHINWSVTRTAAPSLVRSSQTIYREERGADRLPTVTLIDLRFSRPIKFAGNRSIEPQVDVFNLMNSDVIVGMLDVVGARLGYPSQILAPRIFRVGFSVKF